MNHTSFSFAKTDMTPDGNTDAYDVWMRSGLKSDKIQFRMWLGHVFKVARSCWKARYRLPKDGIMTDSVQEFRTRHEAAKWLRETDQVAQRVLVSLLNP